MYVIRVIEAGPCGAKGQCLVSKSQGLMLFKEAVFAECWMHDHFRMPVALEYYEIVPVTVDQARKLAYLVQIGMTPILLDSNDLYDSRARPAS